MNGIHRWLINNLITIVKTCTSWSTPSTSSSLTIQQDINMLERRLLRIQAVLRDAEQRETHEASIMLWLDELQQLAYDAEDVLDELQYEIIRAQVANREVVAFAARKRKGDDDDHEVSQASSDPPNLFSGHSIPNDLGDKIKKVFEQFENIAEGREKFQLRPEDGARRDELAMDMDVGQTTSCVDSSVIIGRDEDKQRVIDLILSEDTMSQGNISVIPIVGMGGIGKTTLARMVYNDPVVCKSFGMRGWVHVGDDFDVVRLTKAIFSSLTDRNCEGEELDQVQNMLNVLLLGKKYLLVLDNVCNESLRHWRSLRAPLFDAGKGKIILTTRSEKVAMIMHKGDPYKIDCLSPDNGWLLFQRCTFSSQDRDCEQCITDIGKQIVKKCGGLPLAIKALGGLLHDQTNKGNWMDVLQNELWQQDESINILPALRLSYNHMPAPLKPCFLYCSLYPKDWDFHKDNLVLEWMAHGFLYSGGQRAYKDIGNTLINELSRRSFFESRINILGQEVLNMHDMIHDLARSIWGDQQLIVRSDSDHHESHNRLSVVRHLYITCRTTALSNFASFKKVKGLRTLVTDDGHFLTYVLQHSALSIDKLRVVSLANSTIMSNGSIEELPDSIGNLIHLRYLDIFCHSLKKLPHSFCNLYNLQSLRVSSDEVEELPDDLGNLINLRYLNLYLLKITRLPESTQYLCNLETLMLDCPKVHQIPVGLKNLTSLRCLQLLLKKTIKLDGIINQLSKLQILHLPGGACWPQGIGRIHSLKMLSPRFNVGSHGSHCAGLSELKDLVNIGPELSIMGIKNVLCVEESKAANLHIKRHVTDMELIWGNGVCMHGNSRLMEMLHNEATVQLDEQVLENLQPHNNIRNLTIDGFGGAKFSKWLSDSSYCNLVSLKLNRCQNCLALPALGQLPSLQELLISHISSMKSIGAEFCRELEANNANRPAFPSLIKVTFRYFPEWTDWLCNELAGDFPVLKMFSLVECPKLQTIQSNMALKELHISRLEKIRADIISCNSFPNLTRLEIIDCENCSTLQPLGHLLFLEELKIVNLPVRSVGQQSYCSSHSTLADGSEVQFSSLLVLDIQDMHEWEEWYARKEDFPVLCDLQITKCPKLQTIPNFTSMKNLHIDGLNNLRSLRLPNCIKHLSIYDCTQLNLIVGLVKPVDELFGSRCPEFDLNEIPANSRTIS